MNEHEEPDSRPLAETAPTTDTQPVAAGPTITYPTLPHRYALEDTGKDAGRGTGSPDAATPAPPFASTSAADSIGPERNGRTPRVRTVTLGLVLLAISVITLLALVTDLRIDGGVVGLGLLVGAGLALVAGGLTAARREAGRAAH